MSELSVFHRWSPAAVLRVRGSDAFSFLQGQFSNDLRELERQLAVYGLWLNHKGRVLADSFVLRAEAPEEFLVVSYTSAAQTVRERLEAYIIADDVTLEDETSAWKGLTWIGSEAGQQKPASTTTRAFPGRRGFPGSVEWLVRGSEEPAPAGTEIETEAMERARIAAGIPAVPVDLGPGELPQEGGLDTEALSYTKGCYLGQEVMARLKSMGQVRRQLRRVSGSGAPPACPAPLYQETKHVGELRSAVRDGDGFVGLALVGLLHLRPEVGLSLAPDAAGTLVLISL